MTDVPTIPALTIHQPFAELIAMGAKKIETRGWHAPPAVIGRRIAIHAGLAKTSLHLCDTPPFDQFIHDPERLPFGAVVATAVLARCTPMEQAAIDQLEEQYPQEHQFGFYALGRFAFVLRHPIRLPEPVPVRGRQGFFNVPRHELGLPDPKPLPVQEAVSA